MIDITKQIETSLDKGVTVYCKNSPPVVGILIDWTSAMDNEPDGESILVRTTGKLIEILVSNIVRIESEKN
jgi:hypothetical protein